VRASVIIPSFQSDATIRACLASVLAQDIGDPFEIFVADSGTDETADIVRREFPSVRLLKSDTRMDPALARNWCSREARGAIFAFIDSDCVAARDWLRRLCVTLEAGTYHGIGGSIRPVDGSNAAAWAGYFCEFREFLPRGTAADATYLTINNAAYRSDTFRRAGGFPEGYFPQEDQVFYQQLRAAGARIRFDPSIVVKHNHRSEVGAFLTHQSRIGAANARVVRDFDLQGRWIAAHPWSAVALFPALTTYRLARTVTACWRQEHCLMLRRPAVTGLCWLGMLAWGIGFARPTAIEATLRRRTAS
jgi:glycosyltransferase involved in cell wall biosynthesis